MSRIGRHNQGKFVLPILGLMADCAHDVSLIALIIDGVAHGFSDPSLSRKKYYSHSNFLLIEGHPAGMIPENGSLFDKKKMKTIRQQLIEILSEGAFTAIDLSQDVGIGEKEVYEHLPHIARSVASQGKKIIIDPSRCLKCGYVFEERKRFTRPGRCPQCRETHIQRPVFRVR